MPYVVRFEDVGRQDVACVGGKNASLGELGRSLAPHGIRTPPGFATKEAYWAYLDANALRGPIEAALKELEQETASLSGVGQRIRAAILNGEWPGEVADAIRKAYADLCSRLHRRDVDVAVRSSATAEDLPTASFAGQLETYLNIRGEGLLDACKKCIASLFTDRAIAYRVAHGFDHVRVALSVGVHGKAACQQVSLHNGSDRAFTFARADHGDAPRGENSVEVSCRHTRFRLKQASNLHCKWLWIPKPQALQ